MSLRAYLSTIINNPMILICWLSTLFLLPPPQDKDPKPPALVARVADHEISRSAVKRLLRRSLPQSSHPLVDSQLGDSWPETLYEAAAEQCIDQRLVHVYLRANGRKANPQEVRLKVMELENSLSETGVKLDQYLETHQLTRKELEYEFEWELAWSWYMDRVLTDEYLQQHFHRHRRRFDGTRMCVAHILIKSGASNDQTTAMEKAQRLYEQLQAATRTQRESRANGEDHQAELQSVWNLAVHEHSKSATRSESSGGDLGWIQFAEPMPPAFSEAAFQLSAGEVSPPVTTFFGVHLIRCLEVQEGKRQWRDAMDEVRQHAQADLFRRIAEEQRKTTKVERFKATGR